MICSKSKCNIALSLHSAMIAHGWERGQKPCESVWGRSGTKRPPAVSTRHAAKAGCAQRIGENKKTEEPMRRALAGLWLIAGTVLASGMTIAVATAQTAGGDD